MNSHDIDENQEKLLEIAELFTEAEAAIKEVEDFNANLIVPAVNQLRYAGNHLIRYLSYSALNPEEELQDALKHVKRATYDAYEAEIMFLLLSFKTFKNDHRKVVVSRVIPDYLSVQEAIGTAHVFI